MVRIYCKNTGTYKEFLEGTPLLDIAPQFEFDKPYEILAAKVNNVAEGLRFRVFHNRDVEFLDYRTYIGRNFYSRSLCFLLYKATRDLFPESRMTIRRPISKGYFCSVYKNDGSFLTEEDVEAIGARMRELVDENIPFKRKELQIEEAIRIFKESGDLDKVKLLETCGEVYITCYSLGDVTDYYYDELVPSTGYLKTFGVKLCHGGILLRVPDRHHPEDLAPLHEEPKTFEVFAETHKWNWIMGLSNVGDVNESILKGNASDLIQISEALQEKKIVQIAEEIERRHNDPENPVKLVLITGPSSSGKSTVCKRLSVQLKACGLHPISFSTDDYFVNRVDTPKLPDGSYDFDNFDTVDHEYLQKDLVKLLNGEEVEVPEYNFVTGRREFNGKNLKLGERSVLLIEGLHALNPRLTEKVPDKEKFRIFINTITSISLDCHNCIPTSDNRLLRRIVRDYLKGAFTARESIANWPNVRRAEVKWIYPFQENADVLFNSAYLVEFAVLRTHAERILATVPKNCPEYSEAHRLLKFLHYFVPVSDKEIPPTSLLRGFIGGGSY
ncbi:MAG: nucleoside kinase [Alistipes sp.]|jgi:uridine kinase|nr:nucleoside kinase [Alistipes sp.]MCI6439308.1 nucleoside kinase [Alistipes sp.]MDD7712285.1 nucleoside kinase [Alistipes sp.]MDY3835346.1 nucleoside kinase [Candidatus Cryptobacteroides sp.]CDD15398.1 phosphoribulokinase/uridine kinase family protein [Alistipes sp. CAG:435]